MVNKYLKLLGIEFKSFVFEIKSSWIEATFSVAFLGAFFLLLIWAFGYSESAKFNQVIPYYILWTLLAGTFGNFITILKSEMQNKTINILNTSDFMFYLIFLFKVVVRIPYDVIVATTFFFLLNLIFGVKVEASLLLGSLLFFLAILPLFIGLILLSSSLVLITKKPDIANVIGNVLIASVLYLLYFFDAYLIFADQLSGANGSLLLILTISGYLSFFVGRFVFNKTNDSVKRSGGY